MATSRRATRRHPRPTCQGVPGARPGSMQLQADAMRRSVPLGGRGAKQRKSFSNLQEAKAWRARGVVAVADGLLRASPATSLREAADELIDGMERGSVRTRSGDIYKPSVVRGLRDVACVCDSCPRSAHARSATSRGGTFSGSSTSWLEEGTGCQHDPEFADADARDLPARGAGWPDRALALRAAALAASRGSAGADRGDRRGTRAACRASTSRPRPLRDRVLRRSAHGRAARAPLARHRPRPGTDPRRTRNGRNGLNDRAQEPRRPAYRADPHRGAA